MLIYLNFTALAFRGVHQPANGRWLTDESERAFPLSRYNSSI